MRLGVSAWIFGDRPLEEVFAFCSRVGCEALELKGEPERIRGEEVRQLSREYRLPVTSVLTWCLADIPGRDLAHPDPSEQERAVEYVCACVNLALDVGAEQVVVLPGPAGRTKPYGARTQDEWDHAFQEEIERVRRALRDLARFAQEKGIRLALEPINRYEGHLLNRVEQALEWLNSLDSPCFSIHLDCFHMNIEEADPLASVRRAGPHLTSLHASDSNRLAPGMGHFPFGGLLETLRAHEFQGSIFLEPVPSSPNPVWAIASLKGQKEVENLVQKGISHLRRLREAKS